MKAADAKTLSCLEPKLRDFRKLVRHLGAYLKEGLTAT